MYFSSYTHTHVYIHVYIHTYKYGYFRLGSEIQEILYQKGRDVFALGFTFSSLTLVKIALR